jgi:hypothetical protein
MSNDKKTDDLEILYPDQEIELGGERVVVREFRYREGLEAVAIGRPLFAGLRALIDSAPGEVSPEDLDALIGAHRDLWLTLVAKSCGRELEWVAALPDAQAMTLQMAFWGANSGFFTRRLLFGAAVAAGLAKGRSASPKSSPRSSSTDSPATSTTSPNDSPGDRSSDSGN